MPIEIKRKEGESIGSFLYRFSKRVQQSGVVREVKRRQFRRRRGNRSQRRTTALYRLKRRGEIARARKLGYR